MVRNVSESEFMQALKEFGYESRDRLIFQALLGRSLRWLTLNYTGVRWLQRDYAFFMKFWDSNNWTPKMPRDLSIWRQFMPPTHFRQKKGWTNKERKRSTWRSREHFHICIHESWSENGSLAGHPLLGSLETTGIPVGLSQLRGSRCLQEEDAWPSTSVDVKNVQGKDVRSLEILKNFIYRLCVWHMALWHLDKWW